MVPHTRAPGGSAASTSSAATVSAMPAAATPAIDTMSPATARCSSTVPAAARGVRGGSSGTGWAGPTGGAAQPPAPGASVARLQAPLHIHPPVPLRFMSLVTLNPRSSPPAQRGGAAPRWVDPQAGPELPAPRRMPRRCMPRPIPPSHRPRPAPLHASPSRHRTFSRSPTATVPLCTRPVTILPRKGCRSVMTTRKEKGSVGGAAQNQAEPRACGCMRRHLWHPCPIPQQQRQQQQQQAHR